MDKVDTLQNLKPYAPGVSGNPAGRPVGALNRSTLYRRHLEKKGIHGLVADDLVMAAIEKALTGDIQALKEIMDSGYGKVKDSTELTGADGAKLFPDTVAINVHKGKTDDPA